MRPVYTFLIFCIIQLGISYAKADELNKDSVCSEGVLVQFHNHYECLCPHTTHVYTSLTECTKKVDLKKCTNDSEADKACGHYAFCKEKVGGVPGIKQYECTCKEGYEDASNANEKICVPTACKSKDCGNGVCVIGHDNNARCACFLGYQLDGETCKNKIAEAACDVKCDSPSECKKHALGVHYCSKDEEAVNDALKHAKKSTFLKPSIDPAVPSGHQSGGQQTGGQQQGGQQQGGQQQGGQQQGGKQQGGQQQGGTQKSSTDTKSTTHKAAKLTGNSVMSSLSKFIFFIIITTIVSLK